MIKHIDLALKILIPLVEYLKRTKAKDNIKRAEKYARDNMPKKSRGKRPLVIVFAFLLLSGCFNGYCDYTYIKIRDEEMYDLYSDTQEEIKTNNKLYKLNLCHIF